MFQRKPPIEPAVERTSSRAEPARREQPAGSVIKPPVRLDIPGFGPPKAGGARPPELQATEPEGNKLIVGQGIHLKAEIKDCDVLVIEGAMQASVDCPYVRIAEPGLLEGDCEIDVVDISGRFNGTLVARDRLLLRRTGRIEGKIRYNKIEIEPGGVIAGDIGSRTTSEQESSKKSGGKADVVKLKKNATD